ncbi:MAG: C40 family peptidase [Candidatus Adiutrix intracellularis]|jgi:hypothetical protein|nr:C40 family peptidase [Candidatus Adiutrix intracellularis]
MSLTHLRTKAGGFNSYVLKIILTVVALLSLTACLTTTTIATRTSILVSPGPYSALSPRPALVPAVPVVQAAAIQAASVQASPVQPLADQYLTVQAPVSDPVVSEAFDRSVSGGSLSSGFSTYNPDLLVAQPDLLAVNLGLMMLTKLFTFESGLIDSGNFFEPPSGALATAGAGGRLLLANGFTEDVTTFDGSGSITPAGTSSLIDLPDLQFDSAPSTGIDGTITHLVQNGSVTESLLVAAYKQAGRHYAKGGQNPVTGFDSPGFTRWVFALKGFNLPREAQSQAAGGREVAKEDIRPGDLLVYRNPVDKNENFHVGIYTGQGNFLHVSSKTGVVTETAAFSPQYAPYFAGARRFLDEPQAVPLSENQKMAATSMAVKLALSELGPNDKVIKPALSLRRTAKVHTKKRK